MEIWGIHIPFTGSSSSSSASTSSGSSSSNGDFGTFALPVSTAIRDTCRKIAYIAKDQYYRVRSLFQSDEGYRRDMAKIAKWAYEKDGTPPPFGFNPEHKFDDLGLQRSNGLKCKVCSHYHKGKKEYISAFAGTANIKDWINNGEQVAGISEQYDDAVKIAKEIDRRVKAEGANLVFVGHSQGGGQAALCAMVTGRKAYTFNAAGVSLATKIRHGVNIITNNNADIEAFISEKDQLHILQISTPLPEADGTKYYIPSRKGTTDDSHSIDSLIKDIEVVMKDKS